VVFRADPEQRLGDRFDLKKFHSDIPGYGPPGLDHLREVMLENGR
jgi:uncharacterized protein (DUF885 family)